MRAEVQRLRERHAESEGHLHSLLTEVTNTRPRLSELEDLRAEIARLKSPPTEPSSQPSNQVGAAAETGIEAAELTEAEVVEFLALPTGDKGRVLALQPEVGVEEWAKRREALDRIATHKVQGLMSLEERSPFDRAFIGVMGIDLGLGDGQWHRIIQPDGSVIFSDPKDQAGTIQP